MCSLWSNRQYGSIGSDTGLASDRCQAIIWSNDCMFYWHVSLGLNELLHTQADTEKLGRKSDSELTINAP